MEYQERYTSRNKINDAYVYYSERNILELYRQLGLYEDIGYSPLELVELLLDNELSKGSKKWDLDKIEKWQEMKIRIKNSKPFSNDSSLFVSDEFNK